MLSIATCLLYFLSLLPVLSVSIAGSSATMFSGTDDAWQRVVRRRLSATEDDACRPAFWRSRRGDYLGLGTCGSIVPALRGTGPVLAHVTRRSVRSLLGHAPSLRMSWPVRPWVTLDSLLALGCVARIGALRALVDSGRTGGPVLVLYSLYQRPEGHALLRVVPRGPAVFRARGPASASGHTAVSSASPAPMMTTMTTTTTTMIM